MKQLALTLSILCALGAFTFAGPEPISSGKEMKQVAPVPPECPKWSGFYIGAFGGFKFGDTDVDLRLTDDWDDPSERGAADTIEARGSGDKVDATGGEAGGLIGYNFQLRNWVFGAEAEGGYLWLRDSDNTDRFSVFFPGFGDIDYNVSTSFRTHYLTTVGGRVGYSFCRWLPYVTGGVAIGDVDFDQTARQHVIFFRQGGSTSETQVGWMVGGGLEYALTNHWRVRGQYQYVDLGSVGFDHNTTAPDFFGNSHIDVKEHNASFALIFGF
jgi:outer membrane immunogenic protein